MLLIYENKGILVPVYFIVSFFGSLFILEVIFKIRLNQYSPYLMFAPGFIVSSVITYKFSEDFYKKANGEKEKLNVRNSFFFIKMEWWAYIEFALGMIGLGIGIYEMVSKLWI